MGKLVKVNVKYRIQDGDLNITPGIKTVTEKEAEKLLKLPYVTKINEKIEVEDEENGDSDTGLTLGEGKGSDDSNLGEDGKNAGDDDLESNNFGELSDDEIKALYEEKTGKKPGNKKINTLIKELTKLNK